MKVIINGLPYFSKKLAEDLQHFAPQHRFIFLDTYNSKLAQLKFLFAIRAADVFISMNGVTDLSGSMDLALKHGKKIWMQWMGTDVSLALQRAKQGNIHRKYTDNAIHFADASWLIDELDTIGIKAKTLHFKWLNTSEKSDSFEFIQVYTYFSNGKEVYYGWNHYKELAIQFPETRFLVAGSEGNNLGEIPANVQFLGWLSPDEMKKLRSKSAIFYRLAEHDGFALSVLEAFSEGSEVVWNYPHANGHLFEKENSANQLKSLISLINNRQLKRNQSNIDYIKNHFKREIILQTIIHQLETIVEE